MEPNNRPVTLIGSGVMASCVAYFLTHKKIQFNWVLGKQQSASTAAGAMITAASEWDFFVDPTAEIENCRMRMEGMEIMSSILEDIGCKFSSDSITVHNNADKDLEKILDYTASLATKLIKGYCGDTATFRESSVNARAFLDLIFLYCKELGFCSIFHKSVSEIYDSSHQSSIALSDGELLQSDIVIACCGNETIKGMEIIQPSYGLYGISFIASKSQASASRQLNTTLGCGLHELPMSIDHSYFGSTSTLLPKATVSSENLQRSILHLTSELGKSHINMGPLSQLTVLSGVRSITKERIPVIKTSSDRKFWSAYGLGRTGFSTAPLIAKQMVSDIVNHTQLSLDLYNVPTKANAIFQDTIKNFESSSKLSRRALDIMSKSIEVVEVISWSEATVNDT